MYTRIGVVVCDVLNQPINREFGHIVSEGPDNSIGDAGSDAGYGDEGLCAVLRSLQ